MKGISIYNQDFPIIAEDETAVKENITRILLTLPGERVNNPTFGSNLRTFLFEIESVMREDVEGEIRRAITRWEPRITIDEIHTELMDERTFSITIDSTFNDTLDSFIYDQLIRL